MEHCLFINAAAQKEHASTIYQVMAPHFIPMLWFIFAVVAFCLFYKPLRSLLPNAKQLKFLGVELSFLQDSMEKAVTLAKKNPQWQVEISQGDEKLVLIRAKRHIELLSEVRILWVDDVPDNNVNEIKMLNDLGLHVTCKANTRDAIDELQNNLYDIVLSDMARGTSNTDGLDMLDKIRQFDRHTHVIFYVGIIDKNMGCPVGAFGITNRPDELLHYIIDATERIKS